MSKTAVSNLSLYTKHKKKKAFVTQCNSDKDSVKDLLYEGSYSTSFLICVVKQRLERSLSEEKIRKLTILYTLFMLCIF